MERLLVALRRTNDLDTIQLAGRLGRERAETQKLLQKAVLSGLVVKTSQNRDRLCKWRITDKGREAVS